MIDLEKTVVIVGLGETGPWGNQRTRWIVEQEGSISIEGNAHFWLFVTNKWIKVVLNWHGLWDLYNIIMDH